MSEASEASENSAVEQSIDEGELKDFRGLVVTYISLPEQIKLAEEPVKQVRITKKKQQKRFHLNKLFCS